MKAVRVSELCAFPTAIDEALAHAAVHSEHEVQGIGAERFFGLKLSGDRGNGPPDTGKSAAQPGGTGSPNHPPGRARTRPDGPMRTAISALASLSRLLSELYVPYMDPSNGWNNRVFIDAGEFYSRIGLLKPLRHGLDCPATAAYFDGLSAGEHGAPKISSQVVCLFERTGSDPAWRHFEDNNVYGRPARELVLRSAAVVGNYDYIMD
jgi:hypothetical protein